VQVYSLYESPCRDSESVLVVITVVARAENGVPMGRMIENAIKSTFQWTFGLGARLSRRRSLI